MEHRTRSWEYRMNSDRHGTVIGRFIRFLETRTSSEWKMFGAGLLIGFLLF